jgi:hypothetical protein
MMTRYSTAAITILLTFAATGATTAQETKAASDKPPATNDTSGMVGDKTKNAESAPAGSQTKGPDTKGTVDVSPGVGAVEGADGTPPLPSKTGK